MFKKKRAQVWVETVIYTLIALTMIGLVLSFVRPKLEEIQDKAIIEQSLSMMEDINSVILSLVQGGPGNKRLIEITIKKGALNIDGNNDKIIFEMESKYTYSQPGENIYSGSLIAHTEKRGEFNIVTLTGNYTEEYNITYKEKDELKSISKASTPYKIFMSNKGGDKPVIDIEVI